MAKKETGKKNTGFYKNLFLTAAEKENKSPGTISLAIFFEPISKMHLRVHGGVVPRIEIITYSVYAPFSIHGTPNPEP